MAFDGQLRARTVRIAGKPRRGMMVCMGATTALMSLAEFERLATADHVELLKGELIRMPPAQFQHNDSADELYHLLRTAIDRLRQTSSGRFGKVHREMGYLFPGDPPSWLQPDVSLSYPGQSKDRYYQGAPMMVFEIVSEFDSAKDLEKKVAMYLENGAAEVWVLYPDPRHAWVYSGANQAALRETRAFHSELLPGVEIPFEAFL